MALEHYRKKRDFDKTPEPQDAAELQATYRALFRPELDDEAIDDIRLALNQPLGNDRFHAQIEQATGIRRGRHARVVNDD